MQRTKKCFATPIILSKYNEFHVWSIVKRTIHDTFSASRLFHPLACCRDLYFIAGQRNFHLSTSLFEQVIIFLTWHNYTQCVNTWTVAKCYHFYIYMWVCTRGLHMSCHCWVYFYIISQSLRGGGKFDTFNSIADEG